MFGWGEEGDGDGDEYECEIDFQAEKGKEDWTYNCQEQHGSVKNEASYGVGTETGDEDGDEELDEADADETFGVERDVFSPRGAVRRVFGVCHRCCCYCYYCLGWLRR